MKNDKTSYSKDKNKKVRKIKFEAFPGDLKNKQTKEIRINKKKLFLIVLIILIFLTLLISSSFLNKMILDYNDKAISKISENKNSDIKNYQNILFKELGYDASKKEKKY